MFRLLFIYEATLNHSHLDGFIRLKIVNETLGRAYFVIFIFL